MSYYCYRHIRLDKNVPFYIGISQTGKKRGYYFRAFDKTQRNRHWKSIIKKAQYEVEIIYECESEDEIKRKEVEFIILHGRRDLATGTLVNMTDGGDGCLNPSEELRLLRSKCRLGKKNSIETRKKISLANKGRKSKVIFNRPHSEETKRKISEIAKKRGPISEQTRKKISIAGIGRIGPNKGKVYTEEEMLKFRKPVIQIDLNGNLVNRFKSVAEALKNHKGDICAALAGRQKTAGGYFWDYEIYSLQSK